MDDDPKSCEDAGGRSLEPNCKASDGSSGNFVSDGNFGELKIYNLESRVQNSSSSLLGPNIGGLIGNLDVREEEDGSMSRFDGNSSDDEEDEDDSMYGSGLGDEDRLNLCVRYGVVEGREGNENPLVMRSSVAFGLDDWDEFEEEMGGGVLGSVALDGLGERRDGELRLEGRDGVGGGEVVGDDGELREGLEDGLVSPVGVRGSEFDRVEEVRDIPAASCHGLAGHNSSSVLMSDVPGDMEFEGDGIGDISMIFHRDKVSGCVDETCDRRSAGYEFEVEEEPISAKLQDLEREPWNVKSEEIMCVGEERFVEDEETVDLEVPVDPLSYASNQLASLPAVYSGGANAEFFEDRKRNISQLKFENSLNPMASNTSTSENVLEHDSEIVKADTLAANDLYEEIVNEMEKILLDSGEPPAAKFTWGLRTFQTHQSLPLRDGGSTASTSGTEDAFPLITQTLRIDGVEVIGARQKKGDVSLSERLVGVKEYTVYVIRVWCKQDQWEVERRYRDFYTLYRRLKTVFADHGWTLPSPWDAIEKESRNILGSASPDVVNDRSILIEECLRSIIHSGFSSSLSTTLAWFLCPQDSYPNSPINTCRTGSVFFEREADQENTSTLGKTISLIIEIKPHKSMKQMLDGQHHKCAGCHKHFDDGMTLMQDFVQTLGWGKPRLCEYTSQLFCSSCHTNDTAVLPARVLHHWDFTQYPVSQLAKSYLDSIYEQPMLCVSAVNPFLFTKVPALHHVTSTRKKIGSFLPYVRCPFRVTINKGLGSRRYLLESTDFLALRDLIDLSKGAFAALPVMLETLSRKIKEHITEQCLICCDVGVPCSARQTCNDPSSLIFPFQDDEIEKCPSCGSAYHKPCIKKITGCFCGAFLRADNAQGASNMLIRMSSGNLFGRKASSSSPPTGLLTWLFSKSHPEKMNNRKDGDAVILMGSLPSTAF